MTEQQTMYDAIGGSKVLDELVEVFYAKVLDDPLLKPLFENFTRKHLEHVSVWLAEVFGGPATFTEELGGHLHILQAHHGLGISEPQRARWAELMKESAREVLPADDRLQDSFGRYIDWGTAIARDVSQPGEAYPDSAGDVPRWHWE
ncbi:MULTISPECIES: group II truncated hemoglobin [unclassified Saccharothrix]|uniref:group II truncated hemoglobin n=1 Tax=unclassified Saccharothrix TaxID=2593673 RepID=UPI00307DDE65